MKKMKTNEFIQKTMERKVSGQIVFRPIKSWHSNTYAGERLEKMPFSKEDGSGCMRRVNGMNMCYIPFTVTHRLYWHKKNPKEKISVFLSYPDGMGACEEYFWEVYSIRKDGDIKRFYGDNAEEEMEKEIVKFLNIKVEKNENV